MSEAMMETTQMREKDATVQSDKPSKTGRLSLFLRSSIPDFLLCLIVSTALTFTISYGFESAASLRTNVLLEAGVSAAMLAALFVGSWSKRALIVSIVATIAVAACVIGAFSSMMPSDVPLFADGAVNDVEGNYLVFAIVAIVIPLIVFLLSRRTTGLFFLLILSALSCGVIQFLYRDWNGSLSSIVAFLVVLAGIVMMFVYQVYRSSLMNATRAKKPAFLQVTGFALLISMLCVGLAFLVYILIVAQLGLTTPVIKPFQQRYQRPEIEYTGTYERQQIEDPTLTTRNLGEEEEETSDSKTEGSSPVAEQIQEALTGVSQAMESFNSGEWAEQFQTLGYQMLDVGNLVIVLVVALAIAAIIGLQRLRRLWRLNRWKKLEPADQIEEMYKFFVNRFGRMSIKRPPNLTLLEWAFANRGTLAPFSKNDRNIDFLKLTLMYQRVAYAQKSVEPDQQESFECFYRAFFKNARRHVGKARWLWKFWRI